MLQKSPPPRKGAGAPKGNQNARKENRLWGDAIRRCITQGKSLDELANRLVALAMQGDMTAMKEIGDRLDGKAVQAIEAEVDSRVIVEILRFANTAAE